MPRETTAIRPETVTGGWPASHRIVPGIRRNSHFRQFEGMDFGQRGGGSMDLRRCLFSVLSFPARRTSKKPTKQPMVAAAQVMNTASGLTVRDDRK